MNSTEFFLWLNGYLEALEANDITECKIENIRIKMEEVKTRSTGERVVYPGPNVSNNPNIPNTAKPNLHYAQQPRK